MVSTLIHLLGVHCKVLVAEGCRGGEAGTALCRTQLHS